MATLSHRRWDTQVDGEARGGRLIQIGDLNLGVPAHDLFALDERPIDDDRFAAVESHCRRRLGRLQLASTPQLVRVGGKPFVDPVVRPLSLGRAHGRKIASELLGVDEQQHILHAHTPCISAMSRFRSVAANTSA
jgi:hypothetical protein